MSENQFLERVDESTATELFVEGGLHQVCEWIQEQTPWDDINEADIETEDGRKVIKSAAYAVARAKTCIQAKQKELTADFKKKAKVIDQAGKEARDFCEDLQAQIKERLTARTAKIDAELAEEARIREEEQEAKDRELEELRAKEVARQEEEQRRIWEEQIREKAAEAAKQKAEAAVLKAEDDARVATRKANQEKIAAVEAERQRQADEQQAEQMIKDQEEADRLAKEQDEEHRIDVENDVCTALQNYGLDIDGARALIVWINEGHIPNVRINYS